MISDWLGILFFALAALAAWVGLRRLANPVRKTESEFEQSVAESASMLGASMNALQEMLDPEAAKSRAVQMELKAGRFSRKKREGKSGGESESGDGTTELERKNQ